jgi:hypothetical protein
MFGGYVSNDSLKECSNMAKAASKKNTSPAPKAVKPGRRPVAAKTTKIVKPAAPVNKPTAIKAAAVSKDELRVQLEKAQHTITALRTRSREAVRAAKVSTAQIAELEAKVAQLEKKLAAQSKPAKPAPVAAKPAKQHGRNAAAKADVVVPAGSDDVTAESTDLTPVEAEITAGD